MLILYSNSAKSTPAPDTFMPLNEEHLNILTAFRNHKNNQKFQTLVKPLQTYVSSPQRPRICYSALMHIQILII